MSYDRGDTLREVAAVDISDQAVPTAAASISRAVTDDWRSLLDSSGLGHLSNALAGLALSSACERAVSDRPGLLTDLKERLGSTKLATRQQVATLLAKHAKQEMGLAPLPTSQSATAASQFFSQERELQCAAAAILGSGCQCTRLRVSPA